MCKRIKFEQYFKARSVVEESRGPAANIMILMFSGFLYGCLTTWRTYLETNDRIDEAEDVFSQQKIKVEQADAID
jgi:hypothetical protein